MKNLDMYQNTCYNPDEADWESILVGHKIVKAELRGDDALVTLEDGTRFKVRGNQGCGGCGSGWYAVSHVASVDNIITAVRTETEPTHDESDGYYDEAYVYHVFVVTGNDEIEMLTVEGDDGNGYYGTGYDLILLED